jgi:hypothetical protein
MKNVEIRTTQNILGQFNDEKNIVYAKFIIKNSFPFKVFEIQWLK